LRCGMEAAEMVLKAREIAEQQKHREIPTTLSLFVPILSQALVAPGTKEVAKAAFVKGVETVFETFEQDGLGAWKHSSDTRSLCIIASFVKFGSVAVWDKVRGALQGAFPQCDLGPLQQLRDMDTPRPAQASEGHGSELGDYQVKLLSQRADATDNKVGKLLHDLNEMQTEANSRMDRVEALLERLTLTQGGQVPTVDVWGGGGLLGAEADDNPLGEAMAMLGGGTGTTTKLGMTPHARADLFEISTILDLDPTLAGLRYNSEVLMDIRCNRWIALPQQKEAEKAVEQILALLHGRVRLPELYWASLRTLVSIWKASQAKSKAEKDSTQATLDSMEEKRSLPEWWTKEEAKANAKRLLAGGAHRGDPPMRARGGGGQCFLCGQMGHFAKQCRSQGQVRRGPDAARGGGGRGGPSHH
jgi:hypothetical protein